MGPRLSDWRSRLDAVLRDPRPFAWGASDCCLFAARCVEAMTGVDLAAPYAYGDAREAAVLLEQHGGVEGIATASLGAPKGALFAFPGDIVLVEAPRPMLGVCVGHRVAVQGSVGIEYVPLSSARKAWGV